MSIEQEILHYMAQRPSATGDLIWEGIDRKCTREQLNTYLHAMTQKKNVLFRKPNMGGKGFFYSVKPFADQPPVVKQEAAPEPALRQEPKKAATMPAPPDNNTIAEPKLERSMSGLRELLFATLEGLRDGAIDPKKAAVTATVAQAILKSAEVQIDFHKAAKAGDIPGDFSRMLLTNHVVNP